MKVYALRQEASLREIGEALGLSFERVRQIEHEALRKLQAVGYPGTAQAASSSLPLGPVAPPTRPTLRSAARYTGDGADSIWTDTGDNPYSLDVAGTATARASCRATTATGSTSSSRARTTATDQSAVVRVE